MLPANKTSHRLLNHSLDFQMTQRWAVPCRPALRARERIRFHLNFKTLRERSTQPRTLPAQSPGIISSQVCGGAGRERSGREEILAYIKTSEILPNLPYIPPQAHSMEPSRKASRPLGAVAGPTRSHHAPIPAIPPARPGGIPTSSRIRAQTHTPAQVHIGPTRQRV